MTKKILVTVCARGGSKGVPGKNIRPLLGKPLIGHTLSQVKEWGKASRIVVSTDSEEIAEVARSFGAEVPFVRPSELATDAAGKLPVIIHALESCIRLYDESYDCVLDLDPTSPLRTPDDIERGYQHFLVTEKEVCFSVTRARKSPYFNMVERNEEGQIRLVAADRFFASRQAAPVVWDMNSSVYFFKSSFLLSHPAKLWDGSLEMFEMKPESAFDIDEERDFIATEALMSANL